MFPESCEGWGGPSALSPLALAQVVVRHFPPEARQVAYAIAAAETGRNPLACGDRGYFIGNEPYWSIGLWQVLTYVRPGRYDRTGLFDPDYNAAAAMDISGGGVNWCPWSVYEESCGQGYTGSYRRYLDEAAEALAAAGADPGDPDGPPVIIYPPGPLAAGAVLPLVLGGALLAAAGLSLARLKE